MTPTEQQKLLLCFHYSNKGFIEYETLLDNILIPKYFSSENEMINAFNYLRNKEFLEGEYTFDTKICKDGILEIESDDNLLKHCILQELKNNEEKTYTDYNLIQKITVNNKQLNQLLIELSHENINEIEMKESRYDNYNFLLKILPKGIKAFNDWKYLKDYNNHLTSSVHNEYVNTKFENSFNNNKGNQALSFDATRDNPQIQNISKAPEQKAKRTSFWEYASWIAAVIGTLIIILSQFKIWPFNK